MKEQTRELPACPECGWNEHSPYGGMKCDPKASAVVTALDNDVDGTANRLGWGGHNFVFEMDDGMHVQFEVSREGRGVHPFQLRDLYLLGDLDRAAVADLVRVLTEWRSRHPPVNDLDEVDAP